MRRRRSSLPGMVIDPVARYYDAFPLPRVPPKHPRHLLLLLGGIRWGGEGDGALGFSKGL